MGAFQNTIDLLGDDVVLKSLIDKSITEFKDDVLTTIGQNALTSTSLQNLDLPNVKVFTDYGANQCSSLKSVNIPNVTSIGGYAFDGDRSLESVRLPATPPTLENINAFNNIKSSCVFYIPTGSLSAYQSATNWGTLTSKYTFVEEDR